MKDILIAFKGFKDTIQDIATQCKVTEAEVEALFILLHKQSKDKH